MAVFPAIRLRPAARRVPPAAALPLAVAGLWSATVAASLVAGRPTPGCALRALTGVPCPTCGGTRGTERLLEGDVLGALAYNPLLFVGLGVAGFVAALRVVARRRVTLEGGPPAHGRLWAAVVLLFALNWTYVVFRWS